ncbi:2-oxo-hepta-3-ene-1,7-dioic acid hydratase [Rhizorhabdus wittichii RW1]|uniref:2-oxo-hepta-3-ene-1,7-dioic acid hydratase n=2 Tax=Rhizorhabdus wittichii TaxID=160791 RepID=A0A9J9LGL6_RHIWR|nr:2-oxo-hepta-3-ene-1,7-dioic acid hydratase [Rhizorhabdus wittichii]ABQ70611.1 2-oxo-hepta-3-ene-1,7-dioic acid hydratase [Rhizorhabdus wittichii RW1]QTH23874.1 2-oxo-hepta-3-ene-1,7-dioic acid hydratase [Rhizorhabdus wittichii]
MAFDTALVAELAARLDRAEQDREQIAQFSRAHDGMTMDDAYAVQAAWIDRKVAAGQTVIGHKIGLTSRAMQRAVNITEPDYGVLLSPMRFHDGQTIPIDRFIEPRVEVEIAFVLKKPLEGPDCTIFDVLNATDHVVPAVEIIDARIERHDRNGGGTRTVLDTIADNAANAGIVIGGRPMRPDAIDLRWAPAILYRNGEIEETGVGAAVLNHPANGPAWLANRLSRFGVSLQAGEIILGGSFTGQVFVRRGDSFHVDFGPLGSIGMHFA